MPDRPKFSLRALLALTTAVAIGTALCTAPREWKPSWVVGVLALIIMAAVPASAIVGIIYGGRYGRAFSCGPLVTGIWMAGLLLIAMRDARTTYVGQGTSFAAGADFFVAFARNAGHDVGAFALCSLAVGLICVVVCWCIGDPNG